MMKQKTAQQDGLREIQMSIAKAVAESTNPSLEQLHQDIIEEIGYRPDLDIIDYFVSISPVAEEELGKYLKHIGVRKKKNSQELRKDPHLVLADTVARGEGPTVLKLRQAFIKKYGEPPSDKITQYFLKMLQTFSEVEKRDADVGYRFAERFAKQSGATVHQFRKAFTEQFGCSPASQVIQLFLQKLQSENGLRQASNTYMSEIEFVEHAVTMNISTVLRFREEFEALYGNMPPEEIIKVFLEKLSG